MSKTIKRILILSCLIAVLILPYFVFAFDINDNPALKKLQTVGTGNPPIGAINGPGPYQTADEFTMSTIIGTIVSTVLSLLGVVFLILIIFAGYNWMTAAGEEEKVKKAKDTLTHAAIGLIIVISAYAIWALIYLKLLI